MILTISFKKWGNSLGVRLPSAIAREMHLEDGTAAELSVEDGQIHIRPQVMAAPLRRQRRPLSFYENRAKERGLAGLVQAVEIMPNDAPRGMETV
jgi:antitoxin component of MazEF toxin-antitoxin module